VISPDTYFIIKKGSAVQNNCQLLTSTAEIRTELKQQ